ncbi:MAG: hypothetical protein MNPFHGCM_01372 [Gemmatimonadaceae bacterium]|nr:hypothetical protein [Gemmatimonadaceae bacterium]
MTWSSSSSGGAANTEPAHAPIAWTPDDLGAHHAHDVPDTSVPDEPLIAANVLEQARHAAFDEGFRAGEDSERTRLFHAARALQDGLSSVHSGVERWIANAEENIAALAVAIARHILSREVTVDRAATVDVVRQAIAEFSIDHPVTVRLHPNDHAEIVPLLVAGEGESGRRDAEWIADARIAPGGCVVEGRERIIDGRVDAALERVYRRLTYTGA